MAEDKPENIPFSSAPRDSTSPADPGVDRRSFLQALGLAGVGATQPGLVGGTGLVEDPEDPFGVLVDTTMCVGCRTCEESCAEANDLPEPAPGTGPDKRTTEDQFCAVTGFENEDADMGYVFVKRGCMHCLQPACASACLTKAMLKTDEGPVVWRPDRCMGCRYCMVSCPFDMPKFEYDSTNPRIRKCNLCVDRVRAGGIPACVENCPVEALSFGKRSELLTEARKRIAEDPDIYVDHIYGEHEAGGTSVLYLASVPFEEVGLPTDIENGSYPELTREFLYGVPVVLTLVPAFLLAVSQATKRVNLIAQNGEAMTEAIQTRPTVSSEVVRCARHVLSELKPKGKLLTPFNMISIPIMLVAAVLLVIRYVYGLGSITNLDQENPWCLWIGFDVVTGVAFAGGAYVITFMVYILNLERYKPIVRVTVLNGLLAYIFYAGALLLDLGRPWNVVNPIIGHSFGFSSVLFLVAWHFLLYMLAEFIEFSPAIAEWLGLRRVRNLLASMTLGAVIFGICLSMLHQSGLGALYLMAKEKIHPLWYSEFIPVLFFVSSIFAGLSMVVFEGTLSHRVFRPLLSPTQRFSQRGIILGLSKVCAGTMFVYLFLKLLVLVHGQQLGLLFTSMGAWYLLEVVGFVLIPCVLFVVAYRRGLVSMARVASILTLVGIVLNRLNVTTIAFKWNAAVRYVPTWMEIVVTLAVISAEIWAFRWIVYRMPVLSDSPALSVPGPQRTTLPRHEMATALEEA